MVEITQKMASIFSGRNWLLLPSVDKIRDRAQNAANMARRDAIDTLMESAKKALSNKISVAFVRTTTAEF